MTKRALLTSFIGMVLVLGLTTNSFAAWYSTSVDSPDYTNGQTWNSVAINVPTPNPAVPGSTSPYLRATFNAMSNGMWNQGSTPETLTFQVWLNGGTLLDTVVVTPYHPGAAGSGTAVNIEKYYDYAAGVYTFTAFSGTENTGEIWRETSYSLSSASTNPTPLPAAVWMLGSGLLGITGFKRFRKNTSA